jgi:hypothetical protein
MKKFLTVIGLFAAVTAGTLTFGSCASSITLQAAYIALRGQHQVLQLTVLIKL